jgi:Uma2 family endonuclease
MVATQQQTDPSLHLWTRVEYHHMGESGLFAGKRVQLIRGQVIEMSPMKSRHATGIELVNQALRSRLGSQGYVREQKPLALTPLSEPEPDIAVVTGSPRDYAQAHPTTAQLVVEVSDSTLKFDQQVKGPLYAEAGIPEYWILNLEDNTLEVYRDPTSEGYQTRQVYPGSAQATVLFDFEVKIPVADLLP